MARKFLPYFYILPLLAFIAVFTYIPIATSINLSFREWDFMSATKPFVGLENYQLLLTSTEFWNSVKITAIFCHHLRAFASGVGIDGR